MSNLQVLSQYQKTSGVLKTKGKSGPISGLLNDLCTHVPLLTSITGEALRWLGKWHRECGLREGKERGV